MGTRQPETGAGDSRGEKSGGESLANGILDGSRRPEPVGSISRRTFLGTGGAGLALGALGAGGNSHSSPDRDAPLPTRGRLLLKDGVVLTMDPSIGDFERADVLIDGGRIVDVRPGIEADAEVVDAAGSVVMPGFIDTHHHQYETIQRAIIADGVLSGGWPERTYSSVVQAIWTQGRNEHFDLGRSPYDPEDNYISELVASLSQIDNGITTGIDTSQSSHTPEHTDAMIEGLRDSGRRSVFAYSGGRGDQPGYEYPGAAGDTSRGIGRLRREFFSSDEQLVTLALGAGVSADNLRLARAFDVPLVSHAFAGFGTAGIDAVDAEGMLGPDQVYIHATQFSDETFRKIADSGGHISIATTIEMSMGHGMPPTQQALDHGIRPSLSTDVETNMAADMFSLMRTTFTLQRALIHERRLAGEAEVPPLLTCDEVLRMATIAGARAAGLDHRVGSLTPGKEADIIMLDARRVNTMPMNNAPGTVVTLMDTSNVRHVFVAGRPVKWQHRLVGVDLEALQRRIENSRDAVLARIREGFPEYDPRLVGSCCLLPP
jgi:5-methylthioadenosine/S-adenosylhomocysteine deaminase